MYYFLDLVLFDASTFIPPLNDTRSERHHNTIKQLIYSSFFLKNFN